MFIVIYEGTLMKLQISFDTPNLEHALEIAGRVADHADILEVGTLLIYTYGATAIEQFKEKFPRKTIMADSKVIDRGKDAVTLFANAGADWMTVMAGTSKHVIHSACSSAANANKKIMLDLVDSSSLAQSAMEAKNLGAHALLLHQPADEQDSLVFLDKWELIKGNASVPVFISAKINRDTVEHILALKPEGIVIGRAITAAEDPAKEAQFYYELCSRQ